MEASTVIIPPDKLMKMRNIILKDEPASQMDAKGRHEEFRLAYSGGSIVAYRTGKVVSNTPECAALVYRTIQKMDFEDGEYAVTIGSDEAGKGEWLGPLVVAAVALTPDQAKHLRALGIMDSKGLARHKIGKKAQEIVGHCQSKHVLVISPKKFNNMFDDFKTEGKNLNDILAWAHSKTISEVFAALEGNVAVSDTRIVVDEFARTKTRLRLARVVDLNDVRLIQQHGAEDVMAVAAASILARDAYELWITRNSDRLNIDLRSINKTQARQNKSMSEFAKVSYLK